MGKSHSLRRSIVGFLIGALLFMHATAARAQVLSLETLPYQVAISDIAIGLTLHQGGNACPNGCKGYFVTVRGPGIVEYTDRGADPQNPPRQRTITEEEFLRVLNRFLTARFLDAPANYRPGRSAALTGDIVQFNYRRSDRPRWSLALRIGTLIRTLDLDSSVPPEMEQLRLLLDGMGGPTAWPKQ